MTAFDIIFTATPLEPMHRPEDRPAIWKGDGCLHIGRAHLQPAGSMAEVEAIFDRSADPSEEEHRFAGLNKYMFVEGPLYLFIKEYLNKYDDDICLIRMRYDGGFMRGDEFIDISKKFCDMKTIVMDEDRVLKELDSRNELSELELYTIYRFTDSERCRKDAPPVQSR